MEALGTPGRTVHAVLLDIRLNHDFGPDVMDAIQGILRAPVFLITVADVKWQYIADCLNAGAAGFEQKPFEYGLLAARLRAAIRMSEIQPPGEPCTSFSFAGWKMDLRRHTLTKPDGVAVKLGVDEWSILCEFLSAPQQVIERGHFHDVCKVKNELLNKKIQNLRMEIEPDLRKPSFIVTVHGVGYKFTPDVTVS